jgi:hypothetical protein
MGLSSSWSCNPTGRDNSRPDENQSWLDARTRTGADRALMAPFEGIHGWLFQTYDISSHVRQSVTLSDIGVPARAAAILLISGHIRLALAP